MSESRPEHRYEREFEIGHRKSRCYADLSADPGYHNIDCPIYHAGADLRHGRPVQKRLECLKVGSTFSSSLKWETDEMVRLEYAERVHRLTGYVLADKLADDYFEEDVHFAFPANTWQMFKDEYQFTWWLGWLVRWRGVKYIKRTQKSRVKVERYASYPEANIVQPRLGRPVIYERVHSMRDY